MKQRKDWAYIRVPRKFKESVEIFIDNHPELGYNAPTQFFIDAARRRLEELRAHEGVAADA